MYTGAESPGKKIEGSTLLFRTREFYGPKILNPTATVIQTRCKLLLILQRLYPSVTVCKNIATDIALLKFVKKQQRFMRKIQHWRCYSPFMVYCFAETRKMLLKSLLDHRFQLTLKSSLQINVGTNGVEQRELRVNAEKSTIHSGKVKRICRNCKTEVYHDFRNCPLRKL